MGKRSKIVIISAVAVFMVSVSLFFFMEKETRIKKEKRVVREDVSEKDEQPIYLYFSSEKSSHLEAEKTFFSHSTEPVSFGKLIIKALAEGSVQRRVRTLPGETVVRSMFVDQDGTCYLDFDNSIKETMIKGCYDEILAVYSVVNSLVINVPEIKRVKILIGGQESETFAGHLDLGQPFNANMYLVR